MRKISEALDFVLFTSGYDDRLVDDRQARGEVEAALAEQGVELAFYWSGPSGEDEDESEHLFGDADTQAWSRAVLDVLKQEAAELPDEHPFDDLVCLRARSADRPLTSDRAGAIYDALHGSDYCTMYSYATETWELEATGQRFVLVQADAESG